MVTHSDMAILKNISTYLASFDDLNVYDISNDSNISAAKIEYTIKKLKCQGYLNQGNTLTDKGKEAIQ